MKGTRTLLCAIAVLLWGFAAMAAAPYSVHLPGGDALIDENGVYIIEPGTYEAIEVIQPGSIYLAGKPGNYIILDAEGTAVSDEPVSMARYSDGVILFGRNGLYGAMDIEGQTVIEPIWTQLITNGEGGYLALMDTPSDSVADEIVYISDTGMPEPTGNYTVGNLPDVRDGRMPILTTDGKYGYVDGSGRLVCEARWLYAGDYMDGAAIVANESGMGLIDIKGDFILECGYQFMQRSSQLIAALFPDGTLEVLRSDGGMKLFSVDTHGASVAVMEDYVVVADKESTRIYARDGRCIRTGSAAAAFTSGLNRQIIFSDGEWGENNVRIISPDGSDVSGTFQHILPLAGNRYAFVNMRGATYYSEVLGAFERSWDYESMRYGMLDGSGNRILPAEYLEIYALEDDRFILVGEDGTHLADEGGGIIKSWLLPEEEQAKD